MRERGPAKTPYLDNFHAGKVGRPKSKKSVITTVVYSEPRQTSKMKVFAKTIIDYKLYFQQWLCSKNWVPVPVLVNSMAKV